MLHTKCIADCIDSQTTSKKLASTRSARSASRTSRATCSKSTATYGRDRRCEPAETETNVEFVFGQSRMNRMNGLRLLVDIVLWSKRIMRYQGLDSSYAVEHV